jgi:hypothetical protein
LSLRLLRAKTFLPFFPKSYIRHRFPRHQKIFFLLI